MVVPVRRKQIPDISPRPPLRHKKKVDDNASASDVMISFSKLPSIKRKAEEKLRIIELEKEKHLQNKRRRRSKGLDSEAKEFKFPSPMKTRDTRKLKDKKENEVSSTLVKCSANISSKQRTHITDQLTTDEEEACFSSPPLSSNDEQSSNEGQLRINNEKDPNGGVSKNYMLCEARKPLPTKNNDRSHQTSKLTNKKQTPNYMTTAGSIDYSAILQRHKMSTRTGDLMESDERTSVTEDDSNSNVNSYVTTSEGIGSSTVGSTVSQISLPVSQNKKHAEYVDMNGSKTIAANPNKKKPKPMKDYNHEKSLTFVNLVHSTPAHSSKRRNLRKEAVTTGIISDKIDENCTFVGNRAPPIATEEPSPPVHVDSSGKSSSDKSYDQSPVVVRQESRLSSNRPKSEIQNRQSLPMASYSKIVEKSRSKGEKSAIIRSGIQENNRRMSQEFPDQPNCASDVGFEQPSPVVVSESNVIEKSQMKGEKSTVMKSQIREPVGQNLQKSSNQQSRQSGTRGRPSSVVAAESNLIEKSQYPGEKSELSTNRVQEIVPQKLQKSSNLTKRESIIQSKQTSPIVVSKSNIIEKSRDRSAITKNPLQEVQPATETSSLYTNSVTNGAGNEFENTVSAEESRLHLTDSSDEDEMEESTIYVRRVKKTPERVFLPTPTLVVPNSADFTPGCRRSRRRRVEAVPGGAKLIYKFTENGQKELVGADKVEVTEEGFYKKYGQYFKPIQYELRNMGPAKMPKTDFELAVRKAEKRAQKLKSGLEDTYSSESMIWHNEAGAPSLKFDKFKISYVDLEQKTSGFVKLRPGYTMTGKNDVNIKYLVIYGVIEVTRDGEVSIKSPQSGYFTIDGRSEYTIKNVDKRPHNEAYFHFMYCF